jgi:hypothetical protein
MTDAGARRARGRSRPSDHLAVLGRIRSLAARPNGLFRVHRERPALYARARRLFGSWSAAVAAAGFDYALVMSTARRRAVETRLRRRRRGRLIARRPDRPTA